MRIIGLDYGRRKVGVAVSAGPLAHPLRVIWGESFEDLLDKSVEASRELGAERVVVGIAGGRISFDQKNFASGLAARTGLPVDLQDETLSTKDAQVLSIEAGISRTKRKAMEDAYSAALILQGYLDR